MIEVQQWTDDLSPNKEKWFMVRLNSVEALELASSLIQQVKNSDPNTKRVEFKWTDKLGRTSEEQGKAVPKGYFSIAVQDVWNCFNCGAPFGAYEGTPHKGKSLCIECAAKRCAYCRELGHYPKCPRKMDFEAVKKPTKRKKASKK